MANILVIRLSAIGDVAMTIPVIYNAAKANPSHSFTVLTQTFLTSLFINKPDNVQVQGIETKGKSFWWLLSFSFSLTKKGFTDVLDLHDVLRTKVIRVILQIYGSSITIYRKDRESRSALTRQKNKVFKPLKPVIKQYEDVFRQAGFKYEESFTSIFQDSPAKTLSFTSITGEKANNIWIGIAPFAKHKGKCYSLELMEKVIKELSSKTTYRLFFFGARGKEEEMLAGWEGKYARTISTAGKLSLNHELALISCLDLLISMDSANMHFASLVNTPVLSIWGATHPYAGFYGFRQKPSYIVQQDLDCRPCSIFGDKVCYRKDWACLNNITLERVIHKVEEIISQLQS